MGKIVIGEQVRQAPQKIFIPAPVFVKPKKEEELKGPTPEQLLEEAKQKVEEAKKEAEEIIANAKTEAARIIKEAEDGAFTHIKKAMEKAKQIEEEARTKAQQIYLEKEEEFKKKAKEEREKLDKEAAEIRERAYKEGYEQGFQSGLPEVRRLIDMLKKIIELAIEKRDRIIEDAEAQIIRIILLITRKVVKAISEEERKVVVENIKAALQKVIGATEVVIRVNTVDLEIATEHKELFLQMFEELRNITIIEDPRVDPGGCIIETDFGSVDARIATQLEEIEEKIRELAQISYFEVGKIVRGETQKPTEAPEEKEKSPEEEMETEMAET